MWKISTPLKCNHAKYNTNNKYSNKVLTSQNAAPRAHIHDNLILKHIGIAHNGSMVRRHAIMIRQHLLLVVELGIGAEVIGKVGGLCFGIAVECGNVVGGGDVAELIVDVCNVPTSLVVAGRRTLATMPSMAPFWRHLVYLLFNSLVYG